MDDKAINFLFFVSFISIFFDISVIFTRNLVKDAANNVKGAIIKKYTF